MSAYTLGLVGAAITLVIIFEMLRRRRLREKYAVFWVFMAAVMVVIAVVPGVLTWSAHITGVKVPANLLFFVSGLVLLGVNVQLSSEVTRLEERARTLAEEQAFLRLRLDDLTAELHQRDPAAEATPAVEPASAQTVERASAPAVEPDSVPAHADSSEHL